MEYMTVLMLSPVSLLILLPRIIFTKTKDHIIHDNFGKIFFVPLLVIVNPMHELAFHSNFTPFYQVFFNSFHNWPPGYYIMPLGFKDFFAAGIAIGFFSSQ